MFNAEYSVVIDMQCPYCKTMNSVMGRLIEDDYYNQYIKYLCNHCNSFWYQDQEGEA